MLCSSTQVPPGSCAYLVPVLKELLFYLRSWDIVMWKVQQWCCGLARLVARNRLRLCQIKGRLQCRLRSPAASFQVLALPRSERFDFGQVTFSSLSLSFLICKVRLMIVSMSWTFVGIKVIGMCKALRTVLAVSAHFYLLEGPESHWHWAQELRQSQFLGVGTAG